MNTSVGEPGVLTALHDFIKWYMLSDPSVSEESPGYAWGPDRRPPAGHGRDGGAGAVHAQQTAASAQAERAGGGAAASHASGRGSQPDPKQCEFAARCTEDIGRQVGGWLKQTRQSEGAQHLCHQVWAFENLFAAAKKAQRGKRREPARTPSTPIRSANKHIRIDIRSARS